MPTPSYGADPVPAVREADATGEAAELFADIRRTLEVDVVNLVWRHLATMPGALQWAWTSLKPLYLGPARRSASAVRAALVLPSVPALPTDVLTAAGIDAAASARIGVVLDSYQHTNGLALVALSALLAAGPAGTRDEASAANDCGGAALPTADSEAPAEPADADSVAAADGRGLGDGRAPARMALPRLTPLAELPLPVASLVTRLNRFGEDRDFELVASMYRHLSHWPGYLALVHTLLAPLHADGRLLALVADSRRLGREQGRRLAEHLPGGRPPACAAQAMAAVRRFVDHPIARMAAVCALIRAVTP